MSPSDLRTRISDEIADLPPMPTVVPDVLDTGTRRERGRRHLGVGLAAAATGLIVLGAAAVPQLMDSAPDSSPAAPADRTGYVTQTLTKKEFDAWAAQKFAEALPGKVSGVRPTTLHSFAAQVAGRAINFNLNITQTNWKDSDLDPSEVDLAPSCADAAPSNCAALPSQNAIAYHETTDDDSAYAGMEMYLDGRSPAADQVAVNFFGKAAEGPIPISNEEILALTESPEFQQIWREYTAHPAWVYSNTIMTMRDSPE